MKIGSLFQFKKYFWFLYPLKEIAAYAELVNNPAAPAAAYAAAYYSKHFKCNVSYIEPSIFMLLEKDGEFLKILSTNGEVGWIIVAEWCKDDIEEVKV